MEDVERTPGTDEDWELGTGLIDDLDLWVVGARFGVRDEYAAKIAGQTDIQAMQLLLTLADEGGEVQGEQGWSCGSGWISSDGGSISHPLRAKIISSSRYGQLIKRVREDLGIDMKPYGSPFRAATWINLGFHWKREMRATITSGEESSVLLPTEFLGDKGPPGSKEDAKPAAGKPKAGAKAAPGELTPEEIKLMPVAEVSKDVKAFQIKAMRIKEVSSNDALVAKVMDESENGTYAKLKAAAAEE